MKSVGAQLREARQARGWTSKAAAKATKIKEQQLLLIENEEYNKFAAPAYVRGFVRIYAKTLGLNEAKLLVELDKILAAEGDDVYLSSSPVQYLPGSQRRNFSPRGVLFFWVVAVLAAMFVMAGVRIYMVLPGRNSAAAKPKKSDDIPAAQAVPAGSADGAVPVAKAVAVPADEPVAKAQPADVDTVAKAEPVAKAQPADASIPAAPAVPAPAAAAVAVAAPATADNLVVQAREDCWVRILIVEKDQPREIFVGIMKSGEERRFTGDKFRIKIAIPAAVNVTFNGDVYHSDTRVPGDFSLPPE